ncbi:MAG: superoxide dismutase [Kiritimatiellaceae bacterium]|jgi:nickel superoxide dismutase|nr:superoxide dismutase [Kiritimatiellaceae bacterium]
MNIKRIAILSICLFSTLQICLGHCQIPCGIYDDLMRIHQMEEHVVTIEKSIKKLADNPNDNQSVRWVLNKEVHADELSEIVTYYFMTQRIKPGMPEYEKKLALLHELLLTSMKVKQEADLSHVTKLNELIHAFEHAYISEAHEH